MEHGDGSSFHPEMEPSPCSTTFSAFPEQLVECFIQGLAYCDAQADGGVVVAFFDRADGLAGDAADFGKVVLRKVLCSPGGFEPEILHILFLLPASVCDVLDKENESDARQHDHHQNIHEGQSKLSVFHQCSALYRAYDRNNIQSCDDDENNGVSAGIIVEAPVYIVPDAVAAENDAAGKYACKVEQIVFEQIVHPAYFDDHHYTFACDCCVERVHVRTAPDFFLALVVFGLCFVVGVCDFEDDYRDDDDFDDDDFDDDFEDDEESDDYDDAFDDLEDEDDYDEPFDDQEEEDGYDNRRHGFDDDLYNDEEEIEEDSDPADMDSY